VTQTNSTGALYTVTEMIPWLYRGRCNDPLYKFTLTHYVDSLINKAQSTQKCHHSSPESDDRRRVMAQFKPCLWSGDNKYAVTQDIP